MSSQAFVFTPATVEDDRSLSLDNSSMNCVDLIIRMIQSNNSDIRTGLSTVNDVLSSFASRVVSDNTLYRWVYVPSYRSNDKLGYKSALIKRIYGFSSLNAGWNNNDNAKPIDIKAMNAAEGLVNSLNYDDLNDWRVFPEEIGSVLFEFSNKTIQAAISIGKDGFSTMVYGDSFYESGNYKGLDILSMMSFIKEVNRKH